MITMDLRKLTLLIVVYGVACTHTSYVAGDVKKVIEMISGLQQHVLNLEAQQQELKGKMMNFQQSTTKKIHENFSKFEGKMVGYQESLMEAYDKILFQLKIGEVGTVNNYYGCDNSTTMPTTGPPTTTMPPSSKPQDCEKLFDMGFSSNGVYTIYVSDIPTKVYCDMANGGWIVLQKRTDDSLDYDRDFREYVDGFGDVSGEHWLGLSSIHSLTSSGHWILHFDLEDFGGDTAWAEYNEFRISAGTDYKLMFDAGSYRGTAGDVEFGLSWHNGMRFSARDMDQDQYGGNCAANFGSGWWFYSCASVVTTGMPYGVHNSILWSEWKAPLKSALMRMKRA